jgi:divalent metal cation (Fe/Co/Zn/Cd) transporter
VTAIPLWIAYQLVRRKPSARFTYGLGRVEDLAGITIVAIILFSALVALSEAVDRLIHPQEISLPWAVAIAGVIDKGTFVKRVPEIVDTPAARDW